MSTCILSEVYNCFGNIKILNDISEVINDLTIFLVLQNKQKTILTLYNYVVTMC